jgi:Ran GTPase-activating protein (RanGAP) involved in mRNA processing and transport
MPVDPYILRRLKNNDPSLTTLDLSPVHHWNNKLDDADVEVLADALKTNTRLTVLILSVNNIRLAGAITLANALIRKKTGLRTLNLSYCNIGAAGAQALANFLTTNTTLTTLHLGGNNIGATETQTLANFLITDTTLTTLHLGGNNIADTQQALSNRLNTVLAQNKDTIKPENPLEPNAAIQAILLLSSKLPANIVLKGIKILNGNRMDAVFNDTETQAYQQKSFSFKIPDADEHLQAASASTSNNKRVKYCN